MTDSTTKIDELAAAAHALLVCKHVLHARDVVKDERDDKAAGVGNQDIDAQTVVEQIHDAKVDDGGNDPPTTPNFMICARSFCIVPALGWRRSAAGMTNSASLAQSPQAGLARSSIAPFLYASSSWRRSALDLAANLDAGIGVAHHAATVGLVKAVGLAFDVDVAGERLGNGGKGLVRLEAASARARDERVAGDARFGVVGATETAVDDQQLAAGTDGLLALGGLTGVWPLMMCPSASRPWVRRQTRA